MKRNLRMIKMNKQGGGQSGMWSARNYVQVYNFEMIKVNIK